MSVFASEFISVRVRTLALGVWVGTVGCVWKAPASGGYRDKEKVLRTIQLSSIRKGLATAMLVSEGRSTADWRALEALSKCTRVAKAKVVFASSLGSATMEVSLGKSTLQVWRLRVRKEATLKQYSGRIREGVVGAVEGL